MFKAVECVFNCSHLSAVQAMFERTEYAVAEDAGTAQVCVVLNIEAMQNVTVRITGGESYLQKHK